MKGHQARKRFGQNFLADPHYLEQLEKIFQAEPSVVAATGSFAAADTVVNVISQPEPGRAKQ